MSRKFKIRDQETVHFVTFTTIQWLDQPVGGQVYLQEPSIATFSLTVFDIAKRTKGWKFMPTVL
jgi:hypothetical protein